MCASFLQVSEQYNKAVASEEVNQALLDEAVRTLNDDAHTPDSSGDPDSAPPGSCCQRCRRRAATCDWSLLPIWRCIQFAVSNTPGLPGPVKRFVHALVSNPLFDVLSMSVIIVNVVRV